MRCEQTPNKLSNLKFNFDKNYLNWDVKDSDLKYYSNYLKFGSFLITNKYAKDFNLSYPSQIIHNSSTNIWRVPSYGNGTIFK